MYDNLIGVAVKPSYTGVASITKPLTDEQCDELMKSTAGGVAICCFKYADGNGAILIATGGEHAEPVMEWLHKVSERDECTTMLSAVIDNGAEPPPSDAFAFTIKRKPLDAASVRQLIASERFIVYLPHRDEFCLFTADLEQWRETSRTFGDCVGGPIELRRRPGTSADEGMAHRPRSSVYDPIAAQIREVMGPLTQLARDTIVDLRWRWNRVWPPVPADVRALDAEIAGEAERIQERLRSVSEMSGARDAVLHDVDRYARILQETRRLANELDAKLLEFEQVPLRRATYQHVTTPLMLCALERYTQDLAHRLGLTQWSYIPVLGERFAITTPIFHGMREVVPAGDGPRSAIVEMPAECRLRVGALPLIALALAWSMTDDLNRIAQLLDRLANDGNRWAQSLRPPPETDISPAGLKKHDAHLVRAAKEVGANLIAAAVAGPPYVFAMARFAFGTLSLSDDGANGSVWHPPFRKLLSSCLAILEQLGNPAGFTSVYLSESAAELPAQVVAMVRTIVTRGSCALGTADIPQILAELRSGLVVQAQPAAVLAALWGAVATRGQYVNEVAAVVSIAAAEFPVLP